MKTTIGKRLRQFRVERDWTLRQLEAFTGVRGSSLGKIELGYCEPNARTLYKLQKAIPQLKELDSTETKIVGFVKNETSPDGTVLAKTSNHRLVLTSL